jgi:hypothetical protein
MERRYRVQKNDTPEMIAAAGRGDTRELYEANKTWMSTDFKPWNPGQQIVIPGAWTAIGGEYPS